MKRTEPSVLINSIKKQRNLLKQQSQNEKYVNIKKYLKTNKMIYVNIRLIIHLITVSLDSKMSKSVFGTIFDDLIAKGKIFFRKLSSYKRAMIRIFLKKFNVQCEIKTKKNKKRCQKKKKKSKGTISNTRNLDHKKQF
ncbi:hypothetical protein BpHYR1_035526 [Brachionus plicatilis]|uniref:Uncharacterized protein n=1 Tax=Brachionus plicatilis TaxID=10195 RepID=A0A3M7PKX5_BRAPC|nr:hypothetical protein BpHYR1_035526 [Brachionus plicatilis]